QAGSAEAARGGLVGLGKALEYAGLGLGGDTDAGVADRELEPDAGFALRLRRNVHRDAAALGELDRVAREIDEDLPQIVRIAAQRRRHLRHDRDDEFDTFRRRLRGEDAR